MSLSSALISSRNGLAANGKWAEITSRNISNVTTEGYGRKTLELTSSANADLQVEGVRREIDAGIDRLHRLEMGRGARQDAILRNIEPYLGALGGTEDNWSMPNRIASFQSDLTFLANNPSDKASQRTVIDSAAALATSIGTASASLKAASDIAGQSASSDVTAANEFLKEIAAIGDAIYREDVGSVRQAALEDDLSRAMDGLSKIMDVRMERTNRGEITLSTSSGTMLVERNKAVPLAYDIQSGRLTAGTIDITPGDSSRRGITEGSLAGHIETRTSVIPRMQTQLDELARGLIDGFAAADASVTAPASSLFVDNDPASSLPLASRLEVNAAFIPEKGGEIWRIRDGAGAVSAGSENDSTQLRAFLAVLDNPMSFSASAGLVPEAKIIDYASVMVADHQMVRVRATEARDGFEQSAQAIATTRSGIEGVNLDQELQRLLEIEQNYSANAMAMKTVGELIDLLLAQF